LTFARRGDRSDPQQTVGRKPAIQPEFPASRVALQMMAQSVAGLAAKAVNEGRGDELVWRFGSRTNWINEVHGKKLSTR
jgi:hypothetical protein